MEYNGFFIQLKKHKIYEEIPIRPMQRDGYSSSRASRRDCKEVLTATTELEVHIEGHRVVNPAFLFELRIILEEFAAKRLGDYKPGKPINSIAEVFPDDEGFIFIERTDSQLVIKYTFDHVDMAVLAVLNVLSAKTLATILGKALQCADFQ